MIWMSYQESQPETSSPAPRFEPRHSRLRGGDRIHSAAQTDSHSSIGKIRCLQGLLGITITELFANNINTIETLIYCICIGEIEDALDTGVGQSPNKDSVLNPDVTCKAMRVVT